MRPFKDQLKREAVALAERTTRSATEERSLKHLEEEILYIEKVEQTRAERLTRDELERENKILQDRLLAVESAGAGAEAHRIVADLQQGLAAGEQRAREREEWARAWIRKMAVGCGLIVILVLVICLLREIANHA